MKKRKEKKKRKERFPKGLQVKFACPPRSSTGLYVDEWCLCQREKLRFTFVYEHHFFFFCFILLDDKNQKKTKRTTKKPMFTALYVYKTNYKTRSLLLPMSSLFFPLNTTNAVV